MCHSKYCEYVELIKYNGYNKIVHYYYKDNKLIPFMIQYFKTNNF